MMTRLSDRRTGDLLVLMVAGTICFVVVFGSIALFGTELVNPGADTAPGLRTIGGVMNTLVGLLAGFLAGKSGIARPEATGPDQPE